MPILTRSNISMTKKRNCIEVETPLIPKSNGTFQKNKKRKLEQEFSTQYNNHKLENKRSAQKTRTKDTPKVDKTERNRQNVKREIPKNNKLDTLPKKTYQRKNKKVVKSKVVKPLNQNEDSQEIAELNNNCQLNFNQRRVSEAIENISNRFSDDNMDECSSKESEYYNKVKNGCEDRKEKALDVEEEKSDGEDYQRKYFELLNTMKGLQEEFLISQQNFEQHVAANNDLGKEMKSVLEDKHNELMCTRDELEICRAQNVELENCKRLNELDMKALNTKVEEMTNDIVVVNKHTNDKENISLKEQINDQRGKLECYKTLTGLTLEKDRSSSENKDGELCQSFFCSIQPAETSKDFKFVLTQDREFAEIQYKPLFCSSEVNQQYSNFPEYLQGQIFFADEQAPKFLLRLLKSVHN